MHTHGSSGRRRGRSRSRILYWFRTPPGVRVGRSALDEDAIRLIEQHNPNVEFDWTRILKGQDGSADERPSTPPDRRTPARPRDLSGRRPEETTAPALAAVPPQSEPQQARPAAEPTDARQHDSAIDTPNEISNPLNAEIVEPSEVEQIEEFLSEPRVDALAPRPHAGDAISAVESRLGSEGLSRLRARYSEVMARISETVSDPTRQEELKSQAERLNPDTWVTEGEVTAGLESYESVFESLRSVIGTRRSRRRRSLDRRRAAPPQQSERPESNDEAVDGQETGEEHGNDQ